MDASREVSGAMGGWVPGAPSGTVPVVRCVLWHAPGSILPGALVSALDRPAIQWKAWDCDFLTLAELCRPDLALDPLTKRARAKVVLLVEPPRLAGLFQVLDTLERFRSATPIWVFEGGATPRLVGMSIAEVKGRYAKPGSATARTNEGESRLHDSPPLRVVTRALGAIIPKSIAATMKPGDSRRAPTHSPPPSREPTSQTSLRLTGSRDEPRIPVNDAPAVPVRDPTGTADHPPEQPSDTLLSEAEIEMLLSDPPPPRNGTPKPGHNVR